MPRLHSPARATQSSTAPSPAADPDTALIHVRHAEAVLRAAERQDADVRAKAAAQVAASAAKVEAAHATLQAARTAALAAARAARRAGRTLSHCTHPTAVPADILLHIASLLPFKHDVLSLANTCTAWRAVLLTSPSPLFRSVRVDVKNLISGKNELPLLAKLKSRAPDVMNLHLSGPKIKREHEWAASLLASFTRLTALTYETLSPRGDWVGLPLAAAATCCPGLVSVIVLAKAKRPPSPADIFPSLGAALGRVTRIAFETHWQAALDAGREQSGTPWLEPATALRELVWEASALPVLPASLALRTLILGSQVRTVPPAAMMPGLRSVRRVAMYLRNDAVMDAVLRGATLLTRFEALPVYNDKPMSPLVADLAALRELSWGMSTPSITPAAALPALSAMRLNFWLASSITVAPGTLDAFTALRTLHIQIYCSGDPLLLSMPAIGPNFAPHLTTLSLKGDGSGSVTLDLAAVATTWEAASLRNLALEKVKLAVTVANVPDGGTRCEARRALSAARRAARDAADGVADAQRCLRKKNRRVDDLVELADDWGIDDEPFFASAGRRDRYRAALDAEAAAAAVVARARDAKAAADRRVDECAVDVVARSLPVALPAVTRVVCAEVFTAHAATAAGDALRALGGRAR